MSDAPLLKDIIDAARIRHVAEALGHVAPDIDTSPFISACLDGLDDLSIMARVRRIAQSLSHVLPGDFAAQVDILRRLAPRLNHGFLAMALSEYVALYGLDDFDVSMNALAELTRYGTSEFAVRPFLRADLKRTLTVMDEWSGHPDEHVRRLASEGSRPRLPWSFRLDALVADPAPLASILNRLRSDPSPYVRRSVANSLNDITKDNPDWALDFLAAWPLAEAGPKWIAGHALRGLIKKGNRRALTLVGASETAEVDIENLTVTPVVKMGESVEISVQIRSTSPSDQRLVVDYAIHYVKKTGKTAPKVFKLKTVTLPAGAMIAFAKRQSLTDFTTRTHYPGTHEVEILVNGQSIAKVRFDLEN
jgi:3-methyladenine DNA glycosylase AlkC